jgi:hypothetical protein
MDIHDVKLTIDKNQRICYLALKNIYKGGTAPYRKVNVNPHAAVGLDDACHTEQQNIPLIKS